LLLLSIKIILNLKYLLGIRFSKSRKEERHLVYKSDIFFSSLNADETK